MYSRNSTHFMEPQCSLPFSQNPALVPILSRVNKVLTFPTHFYRTHLNIILPAMSTPSKWSVSCRIPRHNPLFIFLLPHISRFIASFISFFLLSALSNVQLFLYGSTAPVGLGVLVFEVSRLRSDTPHLVGLLWTKDRPVG